MTTRMARTAADLPPALRFKQHQHDELHPGKQCGRCPITEYNQAMIAASAGRLRLTERGLGVVLGLCAVAVLVAGWLLSYGVGWWL